MIYSFCSAYERKIE